MAPKLVFADETTWIAGTDLLAGFVRWRFKHGASAITTLKNDAAHLVSNINAVVLAFAMISVCFKQEQSSYRDQSPWMI